MAKQLIRVLSLTLGVPATWVCFEAAVASPQEGLLLQRISARTSSSTRRRSWADVQDGEEDGLPSGETSDRDQVDDEVEPPWCDGHCPDHWTTRGGQRVTDLGAREEDEEQEGFIAYTASRSSDSEPHADKNPPPAEKNYADPPASTRTGQAEEGGAEEKKVDPRKGPAAAKQTGREGGGGARTRARKDARRRRPKSIHDRNALSREFPLLPGPCNVGGSPSSRPASPPSPPSPTTNRLPSPHPQPPTPPQGPQGEDQPAPGDPGQYYLAMPVAGVPLPVAGVAVAVPMDPWMVSAEAMGIPVVEMMLRGSGFCATTVGMFATGGVVGGLPETTARPATSSGPVFATGGVVGGLPETTAPATSSGPVFATGAFLASNGPQTTGACSTTGFLASNVVSAPPGSTSPAAPSSSKSPASCTDRIPCIASDVVAPGQGSPTSSGETSPAAASASSAAGCSADAFTRTRSDRKLFNATEFGDLQFASQTQWPRMLDFADRVPRSYAWAPHLEDDCLAKEGDDADSISISTSPVNTNRGQRRSKKSRRYGRAQGGTGAASPPENGASDLMLTALGTAYVTEQCRVLAEQWARPAAAVYLALADSEAVSGGPFETKLWQAAVDLFEKQHKQKQNWLWNFSLQRVAEEFRGRGGGPNVKNARTPADVMYRLLAPQFVQKCTQIRAIHEHEKVRGCADGGLRERLDSGDWRLRWFRKVLEGEGTLPFIVEHVRAFAEDNQPSSVGGREQLSEVVANLDWCVGYGRQWLEAEGLRGKRWTADADDADDLTRETAAADAAAEREGLEPLQQSYSGSPLQQSYSGSPLQQSHSGSHSDEYRAGACVSKGDNFSGANTTSFLWRPESGWQCVPEGPADSRAEGIPLYRQAERGVRYSLKFPDGFGSGCERKTMETASADAAAEREGEPLPWRPESGWQCLPEGLADSREEGIAMGPREKLASVREKHSLKVPDGSGPDGERAGPGEPDLFTQAGVPPARTPERPLVSCPKPLLLSPNKVPGAENFVYVSRGASCTKSGGVRSVTVTAADAKVAPGGGSGPGSSDEARPTEGARSSEHFRSQGTSSAIPLSVSGLLGEKDARKKTRAAEGSVEGLAATECAEEAPGSGAGSGRNKSTIGPAPKDLPLPSGFMRTAGGACKPRGRTPLRVAEPLPNFLREEHLDLLDTPPRREDTRTAQQVLHAILGQFGERAWDNGLRLEGLMLLWLPDGVEGEDSRLLELLRGVERDFAALDVYWAVPEEQELQLFQERALARLTLNNLPPGQEWKALFNKEALGGGASGGHRTCGLRWLLPDHWSREIDGFEAHHRRNGTWENNRRAQDVFGPPPPEHPHIVPTKEVPPTVYSPERLRGSEHWRGPVEVLATLAKEFVFQCKLIAEFQHRDAAALRFFRRALVTDATLQLVALHLKKYRNSQYLDDTSPGYRHLTKVWEDLRQCGRYGVALLSGESEKVEVEGEVEGESCTSETAARATSSTREAEGEEGTTRTQRALRSERLDASATEDTHSGANSSSTTRAARRSQGIGFLGPTNVTAGAAPAGPTASASELLLPPNTEVTPPKSVADRLFDIVVELSRW